MEHALQLRFAPVTPSCWDDLVTLFEAKGGPSYCWCMAWRHRGEETKNNTSDKRKVYLHQRVHTGIPIGLLAYDGDTPIGWCSIAPRETYQRLGGQEKLTKVWSLVCFYIQRTYRHRGIAYYLVTEAIKYAKASGATYVEAYPVDPDSPSYRFMGFTGIFEKAGFQLTGHAGSRRHVMLIKT